MEFIESIDPFLMQLFIVPLIIIGFGLFMSILAKKVFVAPLINIVIESFIRNMVYKF
ncbi:hypothetical protein SAMN05421736_102347 [Evansella caseinilytica]|uniref:Uncharacterized protein n=1 Tax=Evansella caseinilytica TaxID=1503961 RepID=A0A1H3L3L3_9BACI|nr:hypothetical protein SAMN05421736_102347 [Evansella caseinilytica]